MYATINNLIWSHKNESEKLIDELSIGSNDINTNLQLAKYRIQTRNGSKHLCCAHCHKDVLFSDAKTKESSMAINRHSTQSGFRLVKVETRYNLFKFKYALCDECYKKSNSFFGGFKIPTPNFAETFWGGAWYNKELFKIPIYVNESSLNPFIDVDKALYYINKHFEDEYNY